MFTFCIKLCFIERNHFSYYYNLILYFSTDSETYASAHYIWTEDNTINNFIFSRIFCTNTLIIVYELKILTKEYADHFFSSAVTWLYEVKILTEANVPKRFLTRECWVARRDPYNFILVEAISAIHTGLFLRRDDALGVEGPHTALTSTTVQADRPSSLSRAASPAPEGPLPVVNWLYYNQGDFRRLLGQTGHCCLSWPGPCNIWRPGKCKCKPFF